MMWRYRVGLLVFLVWQGCNAQELVNLAEPSFGLGPTRNGPLFDRDLSTYARNKYASYKGRDGLRIRPTKFRITMAAHVPRSDYPEKMRVERRGDTGRIDKFVGDVWTNGTYVGTWSEPMYIDYIFFKFSTRTRIAEIELLGPREALDALWPHGKYPCSQRLSMITARSGPKKFFSRSKHATPKEDLRKLFTAQTYSPTLFHFDAEKPVIIGAELPNLPRVHEVAVFAWELRREGVVKVVLQGSFCQPHCNKFGSKGWVRLGVRRSAWRWHMQYGVRISVENPGKYRAYRLKFIPITGYPTAPNGRVGGVYFQIGGVYFLGCTA